MLPRSKHLKWVEYYVRAYAHCDTHNSHSLTGTGKTKHEAEAILQTIRRDLPFYYDTCKLGKVQGEHVGSQQHEYKRTGNEQTRIIGEMRYA